MPKLYSFRFEQKVILFGIPDKITESSAKEFIAAIRIGSPRNWERKFRGLYIEVTEVTNFELQEKMKYIVTSGETDESITDESLMFIFDKSIDHDRMYEVIQMMIFDNGVEPSLFSAGFIYPKGICGGYSETLGKASNPGDSELYKKLFTNVLSL